APSLTRVGALLPIHLRNPQRLQRHALRVQHPENVVVRLDEQRSRIGKRLILGEPARISMTVWRNDRQVANSLIQLHSHGARGGFSRKKSICIQHGVPYSSSVTPIPAKVCAFRN